MTMIEREIAASLTSSTKYLQLYLERDIRKEKFVIERVYRFVVDQHQGQDRWESVFTTTTEAFQRAGYLEIVEDGKNGFHRVVIYSAGAEDSVVLISDHLIHPRTVFETTPQSRFSKFWVQDWANVPVTVAEPKETCLLIAFGTDADATKFEKAYSASQVHMETLWIDAKKPL